MATKIKNGEKTSVTGTENMSLNDTDNSPVIDMTGIKKSFYVGTENELEVLHGIDLTVMPGEFLSIVGQSGSGKSTLMNIIGLLDKPTAGKYILNSSDISLDSDEDTSHIRNREIGFVFQTYNLIPRMSALKNVELPMLYAGVHGKARKERAEELLELVGMTERMQHTPDELSGGQKQRVAIARALSNDPSIILADEPTGNLDPETGSQIVDLLQDIAEKGTAVIMSTHNYSIVQTFPGRIMKCENAELVDLKSADS